MVFYDPVFGICFLPEILTTVGRIHISRKKHTGETDVLDLDSDAEHQSEKSEHPVQLKSTGIRFLQEKTRRKQLFGVSGRRQNKKIKNTIINGALCAVTERSTTEVHLNLSFHPFVRFSNSGSIPDVLVEKQALLFVS